MTNDFIKHIMTLARHLFDDDKADLTLKVMSTSGETRNDWWTASIASIATVKHETPEKALEDLLADLTKRVHKRLEDASAALDSIK